MFCKLVLNLTSYILLDKSWFISSFWSVNTNVANFFLMLLKFDLNYEVDPFQDDNSPKSLKFLK